MIFPILLNVFFQVMAEEQCDKFKAYENYEEAKAQGIIKDVKRYDRYLGEVEDQESAGTCYAHSVADLIEQNLKSKKMMPVNEHISSVSIALNYKRKEIQNRNKYFISLAKSQNLIRDVVNNYLDKLESLENKLKNKTDELSRFENSLLRSEEREKLKKMESLIHELNNTDLISEARSNYERFYYSIFANEYGSNKKRLELIKEMVSLRKDIETTNDLLYRELNDTIPNSNIIVGDKRILSGGKTFWGYLRYLNKKHFRHLCFESEVDSRHEKIKDLYMKYKWIFQNDLYKPVNLNKSLDYLQYKQHQFEENHDDTFRIAKAIFSQMPFENSNDFYNFITNLDPHENIIDELLKNTCHNIDYVPEFETRVKNIFTRIRVHIGEFDIKELDSILNKNKIALVTYDPIIFKNDQSSYDMDSHISSVVGSMNICEDPYYIVRNSWGEKSCSVHRYDYIHTSNNSNVRENVRKLSSCHDEGHRRVNHLYPECTAVECIEKRYTALQELKKTCEEKFNKKILEEMNHPFFCDLAGNFIISGKQFKKAISSASYIRN